MQETQVRSLDWEDPLKKEVAIHSSTLVRKFSWPGQDKPRSPEDCFQTQSHLVLNDTIYGTLGFPCSSVGKESACNAGDPGSIPASGRSLGEGNGNPLQYSYLENPMNRGAWQATVHGVARVRHNLVTKPPWDPKSLMWVVLCQTHTVSCHNLLA